MSEYDPNLSKHENDLKQIATILKDGNCNEVFCGIRNDAGEDIPYCPLYVDNKDCSTKRRRTRNIKKWMKENNISKADLFEYLFEGGTV